MRHGLLAAAFILATARTSWAQEAPSPAGGAEESPVPAAASPGGVREAEPAVYLLPDGEGGYKPVINFPLDKFKQLLELERQLAAGSSKPAYAVELTGDGVVNGSRARLQLEFQVTVTESGWTRAPLGLDEAVLLSHEHQGGGEYLLLPADDGRGYVAWFRGGEEKPHRLLLTVHVPVTRVGGESQLKLALPRLTTSQFALRLPIRNAVVRAPPGVEIETSDDGDAHVTAVKAVGAGSALDFRWRDPSNDPSGLATAITATGTLQVQLDGQAATTAAELNVSTADGALDRFTVVLPAGATLISGEAEGYAVTPLPAAANSAPGRGALVEVRPLDRSQRQVVVRLVTEQALPSPGSLELVDLAGFDVVGARRQSGFVALRVVGDWQVVFGDRRNMREVASSDLPAAMKTDNLSAGFEYLAQPSSLLVRLAPRRPRVAVEPEYLFRIGADTVKLEARWRYTVRGARVFALDIEFPDESWEIEEIGPPGVVDLDGVLLEQLQPLSIPLLQAGLGEFEIRCRARRRRERADEEVKFTLPRPLANSVGSARLAVLPADNVELTPRREQMAGLVRQPSATIELPPHHQEPLFYRGETGKAQFVADCRVLQRVAAAQLTTRVAWGDAARQVEQQLSFAVKYEPLDRIALRVPRELADPRRCEATLDGQAVAWVADPQGSSADGNWQLVQVALPQPLLGAAELSVRYSLPELPLTPRASVPLILPLVAPHGIEVTRHEAYVELQPGLQARPRGEPWRAAAGASAAGSGGTSLRLVTEGQVSELPLVLSLEDPEAFGAPVVDRAWIQSWLGGGLRQDRAAFLLRTRRPRVAISLPAGAIPATLEVRVDGRRVAATASATGAYLIPLDAPQANREHVSIELIYDLPRPAGMQLQLSPPRFEEDVRVNQTYWQVVVPKNEHVVTGPAIYAAEFDWAWQDYFWGRQPQWEQFELETWSNASHRAALPAATNRYLYGTVGPPIDLELRVAPRWLIVFLASGGALLAGLAVVYVPALRRPTLLVAVLVVFVALGVAFPEPALMLLQAASLGGVLVLVAAVLRRRFARRPSGYTAPSTLVRPGSSIARRVEAAASPSAPAAVGSTSSTDSGSLARQIAGPDSK